jgi:hypothetical protein
MSDPRFHSAHLDFPRLAEYRAARERLFAARGALTIATEWTSYAAPAFAAPAPSRYVLVQEPGRVCVPLPIGMTALGRSRQNDVVVEVMEVSRRHCVLIAHAGGGCEVYDTASLNGTRVNGRRVRHAWLNVGDVLQLCKTRFVLACEDDAAGPGDQPRESDTWATGQWDE